MKKVYNSKQTMPDDMIAGFIAAYPAQVSLGASARVVRRTHLRTKDGKVALLIGNGCGHEPIAMGFVGDGL
ncbi:MAG: dihydroxyacetone kinase-like protein, partial [Dinoroseobacter sp.]